MFKSIALIAVQVFGVLSTDGAANSIFWAGLLEIHDMNKQTYNTFNYWNDIALWRNLGQVSIFCLLLDNYFGNLTHVLPLKKMFRKRHCYKEKGTQENREKNARTALLQRKKVSKNDPCVWIKKRPKYREKDNQ